MLNETVVRNKRILPFHKRADERLSQIQKSMTFAKTAVLKMVDGLFPQNESRFPDVRKVMGYKVD